MPCLSYTKIESCATCEFCHSARTPLLNIPPKTPFPCLCSVVKFLNSFGTPFNEVRPQFLDPFFLPHHNTVHMIPSSKASKKRLACPFVLRALHAMTNLIHILINFKVGSCKILSPDENLNFSNKSAGKVANRKWVLMWWVWWRLELGALVIIFYFLIFTHLRNDKLGGWVWWKFSS